MKRFLMNILLLFILMLGIDTIAGKAFSFLSEKAIGGNTWRNNYICNHTSEEILIFGSSRAIHHYNPNIIERELGMTCYNCGQDGNGIILNYGRYKLISSRYQPKLIIYDVTPNFDFFSEPYKEDNRKYLNWLKPYYDQAIIFNIFRVVDTAENIRMMSQLYRYNSSFLAVMADAVSPQKSVGINGYRPSVGFYHEAEHASSQPMNSEFDPKKVYFMDKFINSLPSSTEIWFVCSPVYSGHSYWCQGIEKVRYYFHSKDIKFYDFSDDTRFSHHQAFFIDNIHMNSQGADMFSKEITKLVQ